MGDPVTMAVIGASAGAMMNKKDPLKGALLGAAGGYAGGAFMPTLGSSSALTGAAGVNAGGMAGAAGSATNLMPGAVGGFGQSVPAMAPAAQGIFSNATYPLAVSQPLSSAAGQTAGMERTFGTMESLLNPNIQSSSLNNESLLQRLGTGAGELGQFAQQNPVLTQIAAQTGQSLLQQREPQLQSPGLMRGNPSQVAATQYQVGIPKVSLI